MAASSQHSSNPSTSLGRQHDDVLGHIEDLSEALHSLQYEGKVHFSRNMRQIRQVVEYLKGELSRHMQEDDDVIFPFIERAIPKLSLMVSFLRSEHSEFRDTLDQFERILVRIEEKDAPQKEITQNLIKLRHKGTYLVCLMRNHVRAETESVYNAITNYLNDNEREQLREALTSYRRSKTRKRV